MIWNIVIGICSFVAYISIWQIVKLVKFVIPFTDEMIELGIISPSSRGQLLFVKTVGASFLHVIAQVVGGIGVYINFPAGIKVYAIVAIATLLLLHPSKDRYTRSSYTINEYIREHSICMDLEKMKEIF